MKFNLVFLTTCLIGTTELYGSVLMHCLHNERDGSHARRRNELIVFKNGDDSYSYVAVSCYGHPYVCSTDPDYESQGTIEREYYSGSPTLRFKGEGISIQPFFFAGTINYRDEGRAGLVFKREECAINEN